MCLSVSVLKFASEKIHDEDTKNSERLFSDRLLKPEGVNENVDLSFLGKAALSAQTSSRSAV